VGEIVKDDNSGKPCYVSAHGRQWWYNREALRLLVCDAAVSPCRRVVVSSCRLVVVSSCRRVAVSPCRRVVASSR
jgi:hypothetical protein